MLLCYMGSSSREKDVSEARRKKKQQKTKRIDFRVEISAVVYCEKAKGKKKHGLRR